MKVVLDTNVVVSGLLSPFGPPGEIIRMVASGLLELCYDARILSEYQNVLTRQKFPFDQAHVEDLLKQIEACGHITTGKPLAKRLSDPDDEPFLEVALGGKAQYLITGNLKHYPVKKQQGMQVVSPSEFLEIYRKSIS
ncbi:MAG: putative toxin-antitoxin system toxin component, PIN family [bacterium (Candidatus Ratteibacteria) CG_4_10_14_3_um_filter_41_18]|uniref:Putative toxin-antitoxin system toxin component, PIN family n=4 Tax=Candidatus Ratteibacteria TaxID=2979319 RepID=A0A2M7YEX0_9BACT|nr:MAG: putative toxin-antitoxin system toxin component, PIN family [Candidatus Omnitrophica bacterium CG1_02_41_171]PIV63874.1 MAG: putative toxin-antitoxin system toxin component, PIN family [bacterium (Candidatus Ratteibacteria) CG01_land_8_20_14_3_00_40_19]PIW32674.1 MAG: putative toxin-antitoxin system toxin component, PIN family [bacterium (Candidatus Ratteibacteria) CG15_BIG_FIL_POST_REV_8_21_14_020_41_12]PIW74233.1 MAG: putative toxin-antitoxin system toxin component, PIN family [bacteri